MNISGPFTQMASPYGKVLWTYETYYLSSTETKNFHGIEIPLKAVTISVWPKVKGVGNITIKVSGNVCEENKRYNRLDLAMKKARKIIEK